MMKHRMKTICSNESTWASANISAENAEISISKIKVERKQTSI